VCSHDPERSPTIVNTVQFAFHYSVLGQSRGTCCPFDESGNSRRCHWCGNRVSFVGDAVVGALRDRFVPTISRQSSNFAGTQLIMPREIGPR